MNFKFLFKNKKANTPPEMKYLIVGLGNIGSEYEDTRHNIGFNVLNELAKQEGLKFDNLRYGAVSNYKYKGNHRDRYYLSILNWSGWKIPEQ